MAHTRRVYSDKDRAAVHAELTATSGNVKRTARHLGIPAPTVSRWKKEWEMNGTPAEVSVEIQAVSEDFIENATRLRNKLLVELERMADAGQLTGNQVATSFGIVTDKIRAYENIPSQKVEHTFQLPPPEEMRALFRGAIEGVVDAAKVRAAEIDSAREEPLEAEYLELPVSTTKEINSV